MVTLKTLGLQSYQARVERLACLDAIVWSFIYYARWYVMIRVAVRQRPCSGRGCWSGSILRMGVWGGSRVELARREGTGRELAAIRHHHRADCRTRTDVLLTGELSALDTNVE